MNIGGIFAILDDVAATLDDVAVMSKVAAKKTAGILGDDLAVNANMSAQFASNRELPVLWAIAKGSFINKLIILPAAFLLSAFAPWLIVPILLLGALYLGYEGAEKIEEWIHNFFAKKHPHNDTFQSHEHNLEDESEQQKIKKAITTDFILSIEIIVIALGTVVGEPLLNQIIVTSAIAILATVGVYGLVALLVRTDDFGFKLIKIAEQKNSSSIQNFGQFLVNLMPKMIKSLTVIGVIAMLLVAGGIFVHNIQYLHHFDVLNNIIGEFVFGLCVGFIVVGVSKIYGLIFLKK